VTRRDQAWAAKNTCETKPKDEKKVKAWFEISGRCGDDLGELNPKGLI
jgi:hypothetical protein